MESLVSTEELAAGLGTPGPRLLDASYFPLDPARDPAADFVAGHIPGARFLDLGGLADPASDLPGMLPPAAQFAARMEKLGVGDSDRIVLYDATPHRTSARAWWMFRVFGRDDVAILDGGLPKWVAEGRALETGEGQALPARFTARRQAALVRGLGEMFANVKSGAEQVVDARGARRFTGEEGDPRGLASGHIPGSRNLPMDRLLNPDGTFKDAAGLGAAFAAAGVDLDRPLVTTCGSGVTAATLMFGAWLLGKRDMALYDGSWSEWGARDDTPKETGKETGSA